MSNNKKKLLKKKLSKILGLLSENTVFGAGEEEMSVGDKVQAHDVVLVGEDGAMTVAEVQSPDLDVAIGTCRNNRVFRVNQSIVAGFSNRLCRDKSINMQINLLKID